MPPAGKSTSWGEGLVQKLIADGRLPRDVLSRQRPGMLVASSATTSSPPARPLATEVVVTGPKMNKTETRYHQRLVAAGHRPRFAAITLCLTDRSGRRIRYTPDFSLLVDGVIELHEVKGAHVYEDGKLKFEFAVEQWGHAYAFVWSQWRRGEWTCRRYPRRTQET